MGCIYALYFFTKMDKNWKEQFIDSYISIAAPYGGAVEAVDEILAGSSAGNSYVQAFRSMSGIMSLLPVPSGFTDADILVKYDNIREEYRINTGLSEDEDLSVDDIPLFFKWLNLTESESMYKDVFDYREHMVHPGVDSYCYYSSNVSTVEQLSFDDSDPDNTFPMNPKRTYGDGDGTVNLKSLRACEQFSLLSEDHIFKSFQFNSVQHTQMVMHCDVIDSILDTLVDIHKQEDGNKVVRN